MCDLRTQPRSQGPLYSYLEKVVIQFLEVGRERTLGTRLLRTLVATCATCIPPTYAGSFFRFVYLLVFYSHLVKRLFEVN